MKAEKAKEIIDLNIKVAGKTMPPDVKDSLIIASEAIHWLLQWRGTNSSLSNVRLPSETED